MAECILMKSGGGTGSDECNAARSDVLAGKTAVTKDSNDDPAAGTMPNKGAWTSRIGVNGKAMIPAGYHNGSGYVDQAITNRGAVSAALGINGTYTIPEGYHNGAGKVTQSIATMGAQTVTPGNSQKVVSCSGKYMTGNVTVSAVSGLTAANIKKGVVVGGVTGTWEGYVATPTDIYKYGAVQYGLQFNKDHDSTYTKFNSTSISIYSGGDYMYTTQQINLTAYTGIEIELSSDSASLATTGTVAISAGAKTDAFGTTIAMTGDKYTRFGDTTSHQTLKIPFTGNKNVTAALGFRPTTSAGRMINLIYRIRLY